MDVLPWEGFLHLRNKVNRKGQGMSCKTRTRGPLGLWPLSLTLCLLPIEHIHIEEFQKIIEVSSRVSHERPC